MSKIAAVKARLGLTSPEHDRELREIFDAVAEAHPALAQSDLVQVEVMVRRFQLEKIEATHRDIGKTIADFQAGLPKAVETAVEYQKTEMLRALRIAAADEVKKAGAQARKEMCAGDRAEPARSFGTAAVVAVSLVIFGVAVGLALPGEYAYLRTWLRLDYVLAALAGAVGWTLLRALIGGTVEMFTDGR